MIKEQNARRIRRCRGIAPPLIMLVALVVMAGSARGQTSSLVQPPLVQSRATVLGAGVPSNAVVTVTVAQPVAAAVNTAQAGGAAMTQPGTISITFGPGPVTQAGMSQLFGEVMQCLSQVNPEPRPLPADFGQGGYGQGISGNQQLSQQQVQQDQWKEDVWRQQLQQDFWKQQLWQQQLEQDAWKRQLWRQQLRQDWWKQQLRN